MIFLSLSPPQVASLILALALVAAAGLFSTHEKLTKCNSIGASSSSPPPPPSLRIHQDPPSRMQQQSSLAKYNADEDDLIEIITPDVARDNDLVGKTCRFVLESKNWDCRDCGLLGRYGDWKDCPVLRRNHMCGDVANSNDWDRPLPRKYTYMDPLSYETRNILTFYAEPEKQFEQIPCDPIDECWDMTKCPSEGPMTVYVRHSGANPKKNKAKHYLDLATKRYPSVVQAVEDPSDACMLVVACDAYEAVEHLQNSSLWNEGRNHMIWEANRCFEGLADRPFDGRSGIHYARASLATSSLTDANVRPKYDMLLARTSAFRISEQNYTTLLDTMGHKRRWLVAFKGNVYNRRHQVWWDHRWMAAEYWDKTDPEVAVDVTCDIKPNYTAEYDYTHLMMNSTFFFCPGGGATQSFRFTEALAMGAIPVVTPDLLPPFAYDLDWSQCVVRVSEARIIDLPRLLRGISEEEIRQRQRRCQELFEKTVGWVPFHGQWRIDVDRTLFMASLKIWAWRIRQFYAAKRAQAELEDSLFVVSKDGNHDYVEWKH